MKPEKHEYYTSYYGNEADEEKPKSSKPRVYERKNEMIKIYNGHVGTLVWEKEDDTKTT
jgi:hypothetical protein